jgi:D-glycero-beta-D-manno-heptose 1-phosphate adenylyltransferase
MSDYTQLENFLQRNQGKSIVFTNGCFDIVHIGHIQYLNEAKKLADLLVVGINSDQSVKKLKGNDRPINSEQDRAFFLMNLKAVDFVVIFDQDTPLELIKRVKPNVLVKGGDWPIEKIVGHEEVIATGGQVLSLSFLDGYSTTNIINKIKSN